MSRLVRGVLAYIAAATVALWGVAHVIPTRKVVAGFAPITLDNRRVLTQEWLAEALAMWGVASVVVVVTAVAGGATMRVYRLFAGLLIAQAALTAATGARTPLIWFKLCPVLLVAAVDFQRGVARRHTYLDRGLLAAEQDDAARSGAACTHAKRVLEIRGEHSRSARGTAHRKGHLRRHRSV